MAISRMQNGKVPGPDGISCEFYEEWQTLLLELMLNMFNYSYRSRQLPESLREANISLILKKGKPPEACSSYRPISLLNVDRKVLAKILASRLENVITDVM